MIPRAIRNYATEHFPDWLYALSMNASNMYRIPMGLDAIRIKRDGINWLVTRDGITIMSPTAKHLGVDMRVFERRFESVFEIEKQDVALDVGAAIGDTTVPFAMKAKKVIAVEPEPRNIECLKYNMRAFDCEIIPKAAWSKKETLDFFVNERITGHSLLNRSEEDDFFKKVMRVDADTIDNMVAGKHVDFFKLDVQGAELNALIGSEKTLNSAKKIVIETHIVDGKSTAPDVIKFLKDRGFKLKAINEHYIPSDTTFQIIHAWRE